MHQDVHGCLHRRGEGASRIVTVPLVATMVQIFLSLGLTHTPKIAGPWLLFVTTTKDNPPMPSAFAPTQTVTCDAPRGTDDGQVAVFFAMDSGVFPFPQRPIDLRTFVQQQPRHQRGRSRRQRTAASAPFLLALWSTSAPFSSNSRAASPAFRRRRTTASDRPRPPGRPPRLGPAAARPRRGPLCRR